MGALTPNIGHTRHWIPPRFKADAVALYESRPEATIRSVAADLGINPETLRMGEGSRGEPCPRTADAGTSPAAGTAGGGERRLTEEGP